MEPCSTSPVKHFPCRSTGPVFCAGSRNVRAVGVEDGPDEGVDAVSAVEGHGPRLGEAIGRIVAAVHANGIDVAPVVFTLWVPLGVAIDFARAREEVAGLVQLGQAEGVV